jgi:predicted ferric reductase
MSDDKAARLAAIRAKNAAQNPAPTAAGPASISVKPQVPAAPIRDAEDETALDGTSVLAILFAVVVGALAAAIVLPRWLPGLLASLLGEKPTAFWYLSRSSAMVAYSLIWLSMVLGLSLTGKIARLWPGGPTALDMHQHTSVLGLAFGLFHALILLGDGYIGYSLRSVLVPFASAEYRPLWVGLGQIALYGLGIVTLSFYLKPWIGRRAWRIIHYLSFLLFVLSLGHGIFSGTDTSSALIRGFYWATGGSVVFLTVYRVLIARRARPALKSA